MVWAIFRGAALLPEHGARRTRGCPRTCRLALRRAAAFQRIQDAPELTVLSLVPLMLWGFSRRQISIRVAALVVCFLDLLSQPWATPANFFGCSKTLVLVESCNGLLPGRSVIGKFVANLATIAGVFAREPAFVAGLLVLVGAIAHARLRARAAILLLTSIVAGVVLCALGPQRYQPRYLVPTLTALSLLPPALDGLALPVGRWRWVRESAGVLVALAFLQAPVRAAINLDDKARKYAPVGSLDQLTPCVGVEHLYSWPVSSPIYALLYGDQFAGGLMSSTLAKRFLRDAMLIPFSTDVYAPDGTVWELPRYLQERGGRACLLYSRRAVPWFNRAKDVSARTIAKRGPHEVAILRLTPGKDSGSSMRPTP